VETGATHYGPRPGSSSFAEVLQALRQQYVACLGRRSGGLAPPRPRTSFCDAYRTRALGLPQEQTRLFFARYDQVRRSAALSAPRRQDFYPPLQLQLLYDQAHLTAGSGQASARTKPLSFLPTAALRLHVACMCGMGAAPGKQPIDGRAPLTTRPDGRRVASAEQGRARERYDKFMALNRLLPQAQPQRQTHCRSTAGSESSSWRNPARS
jgi:hypothetical protein